MDGTAPSVVQKQVCRPPPPRRHPAATPPPPRPIHPPPPAPGPAERAASAFEHSPQDVPAIVTPPCLFRTGPRRCARVGPPPPVHVSSRGPARARGGPEFSDRRRPIRRRDHSEEAARASQRRIRLRPPGTRTAPSVAPSNSRHVRRRSTPAAAPYPVRRP